MRVLLVDLERAWRGGQSQALLLLRGLRERGHNAELVAPANSALAERAAASGIIVHVGAAKDRRWGAARVLRRLLREIRVDIVHANEAHALTAAWLARAHKHAPLVAARRVTFPLSRGYLSLARYRAAACIVAISQAVREQLLAAGLDPQRIAIVADGVEVPPYVSETQRSSARARWGFAPSNQVLALVAPLTAEKGHALLLDAFAALRRDAPQARLLLAGDGPLRPALEARARAANLADEVRFAGFVEDVDAVYAASDVFVFPSLSEGAGTSLLSAMARALPVVALARGGITEIVQDGSNGLLVQEADPAALASAAARLLADRDLARRLGEMARETVIARFSADRMVNSTLAVFERLVRSSAITAP
jgi:glycosyltransferase involved in cell wall biosynthesis